MKNKTITELLDECIKLGASEASLEVTKKSKDCIASVRDENRTEYANAVAKDPETALIDLVAKLREIHHE